jgi:hypothetical protein
MEHLGKGVTEKREVIMECLVKRLDVDNRAPGEK